MTLTHSIRLNWVPSFVDWYYQLPLLASTHITEEHSHFVKSQLIVYCKDIYPKHDSTGQAPSFVVDWYYQLPLFLKHQQQHQ